MEVMEKNPQLRKPVGTYLKMTEEQRQREIEFKQEIYRMDQQSRINGAYRDGKKEGIQEGREEAKREAARKLKAMGLSGAQIAEAIELSPEEIEKLHPEER